MKFFSASFISSARRVALLAFALFAGAPAFAAGTNAPAGESYDYTNPSLLTGTLYAIGSGRQDALFTYRRTATRSNDLVHVTREYFTSHGSLAAVEKIVYASGRLVAYEMQDFQAQVSGSIQIAPNPRNPASEQITIGFGPGLTPPKGATENLPANTVIDDTLYPFMLVHWDELMRGKSVKFEFVSLEHERTFEFRLVKTAGTTLNGQAVVTIKLEAVNPFVAEFVAPMILTVEKENPHHILSYTGRTTPRIKMEKSWKPLDAETVFQWP